MEWAILRLRERNGENTDQGRAQAGTVPEKCGSADGEIGGFSSGGGGADSGNCEISARLHHGEQFRWRQGTAHLLCGDG